ncbi:MAG: hypothetical protein IJM30_01110 [Thermoguttaceae bacterium]|nr:hypothetical protein [Thermoguttaceae bacterium]
MSEKTEVLIVKNPMFYKDLAPTAFEALIPDGRWIPLAFGAIEKVVQDHFFALCELDWDYLREPPESLGAEYQNYKSLYFRGLDDAQTEFVQKVADQIEEEIKEAAEAALLAEQARESAEEEE